LRGGKQIAQMREKSIGTVQRRTPGLSREGSVKFQGSRVTDRRACGRKAVRNQSDVKKRRD